MALEVGVAAGSTVAIELPLTRTEIAQYLALNADTLSRLMSRFKATGHHQKSRHQIALRNWRAISDMCPVTPALLAVERTVRRRYPKAPATGRGYSSVPASPFSSSPSEIPSTETTFSSASVLKMRTPCVLRPAMRPSSTGQRINCPPSVTSMI